MIIGDGASGKSCFLHRYENNDISNQMYYALFHVFYRYLEGSYEEGCEPTTFEVMVKQITLAGKTIELK